MEISTMMSSSVTQRIRTTLTVTDASAEWGTGR